MNQHSPIDGGSDAGRKKPRVAPIPSLVDPSVNVNEFKLSNSLVLTEEGLLKEERKDDKDGIFVSALSEIEIYEELGKGTSGSVSRVLHKPSGKYLALKEMTFNFDESFKKQLKIELDTLISCISPYIVKCYNVFLAKGTVRIVMEYMDRGTLTSILKEIGNIPEVILAVIAHQVLKGLEYLHKTKKIIHRDIKPSNLLVNSDGMVKISDFGVSGQLEQTLEYKNTWVGTSIYMSPERLRGDKYINDTDLWSLGLTLMECALGKFPLEFNKKAKLWDLIGMHEKPVPKLPKEFSPEFSDFLDICLNKEAGKRSSASELLQHNFVKKFADGKGINQFKGWLGFVYKKE